jgi:hypothetical protein
VATEQDLPLCRGCRDDFYNDHSGTKRCWSFAKASVVIRYAIGWWTQPTQPNAYRKVKTLSCHHRPGQCALHQTVADCCPNKLEIEAQQPGPL